MKTISSKVSDAEYALFLSIAEEKNLTISALIKQAILDAKIVDKKAEKKDKNDLFFFLNRIGNNLNQIARKCNENNKINIETLSSILEIKEEIKKWS